MESKRSALIDLSSRRFGNTKIADMLGISHQAVYAIKKRYAASGSVKRQAEQANVDAVQKEIEENPVRCMRPMAKAMSTSRESMERIVKEDLGMQSRARRKKHLINNSTKRGEIEEAPQ